MASQSGRVSPLWERQATFLLDECEVVSLYGTRFHEIVPHRTGGRLSCFPVHTVTQTSYNCCWNMVQMPICKPRLVLLLTLCASVCLTTVRLAYSTTIILCGCTTEVTSKVHKLSLLCLPREFAKCCIDLALSSQSSVYRITGFNCVLKSLRFRDFKVIANLNSVFVWHMRYYSNRSGYPLVLVLGTKCLVQTRSFLESE